MMKLCGVSNDKIRTISSSIDKLDKLTWDEVFVEMTQEKKLPIDVANKIKEFVNINGFFI